MRKSVILPLLPLFLAACTAGQAAAPASHPASTKVITEFRELANAKAADVAAVLRQLLPITAEADPPTNTVILRGPAVHVATAVDLINKLDVSNVDLPPDVRFIHRMQNVRARDLVPVLRDMAARGFFEQASPDLLGPAASPPMFDADEGQNLLIVRVPRGSDGRVRQIIEAFDKPLETK